MSFAPTFAEIHKFLSSKHSADGAYGKTVLCTYGVPILFGTPFRFLHIVNIEVSLATRALLPLLTKALLGTSLCRGSPL
jgi:hypothetical protein